MRIVFALLAHDKPDIVAHLVRTMVGAGHRMAIHLDAKLPDAPYRELLDAFGTHPDVRFARRVTVAWGEWSVVQATLNCLAEIEAAAWEPDYVYLMSGMDFPIRSSAELVGFLDRNRGDEFIESVPSDTVRWVKSGPQRARYQYRWYLNWRRHPLLTDYLFNLQRRLGLRRQFVRSMAPHLGSQWWILTWPTLKKIVALGRQPDIVSFFRTTLVPDELFFQTLIRQFVPDNKIIGCSLTLYQFTDYGYPVVYHIDHLDYLSRQPFFMARKLSPHAMELRQALEPYWAGAKAARPFDDEDVGLRGTEYEDRRLAYREGPPGRPLVGAVGLAWTETPRRTVRTHLAVIGTSTEELRFVHRVLSHNAELRLHGQLFHPARIEFARGASHFASYGRGDVAMRDVSALDFLSDVVRAEPERVTGFLLRWGQDGPVTEGLFKRAGARLVVLGGDPLVSFSENVAGPHPALDQAFDPDAVTAVPPEAAAHRFRAFLRDYRAHVDWIDHLVSTTGGVRPKGWMGRFDPGRVGPDWLKRLEGCVGVNLAITPDGFEAERRAAAARFAARVRLATDLLVAGGVDPVVFDVLRREAGHPALALPFL